VREEKNSFTHQTVLEKSVFGKKKKQLTTHSSDYIHHIDNTLVSLWVHLKICPATLLIVARQLHATLFFSPAPSKELFFLKASYVQSSYLKLTSLAMD